MLDAHRDAFKPSATSQGVHAAHASPPGPSRVLCHQGEGHGGDGAGAGGPGGDAGESERSAAEQTGLGQAAHCGPAGSHALQIQQK